MIHIAYITTEYPHPDLSPAGGIGSFIKMMATSLQSSGHQVTVFLCLSDRDYSWYDNDIRIVEIKSVRPSKFAPIKNRLKIRNRIKRHIKNDKVDIIEAPDWEGIHAFCDFKIPLITRIHGSVTYFNHLQGMHKPRLLYFLEKWAIKKSKKVIAVSQFSGEVTEEVFSFPHLPFETIYNGIDISIFEPSETTSSDNQNILYFGTLVRKKGMISLAHIFNLLHSINPKVTLTLIGKDAIDSVENTSTWHVMKNIITPSALTQVDYKGVVPYHEMSQAISQCNICVFPSFAEAFPISWLEAMAMQKPIVASSIGWANESIEDTESGLLEFPESHNAFAKKINTLLSDQTLASTIGRNARERVARLFDQNKLVMQNINMYKRVLNDK